MKKTKLLLVGTSGGHLTEVLTLFEPVPNAEIIVFSERSARLSEISHKSYSLKRSRSQILHMLFSTLMALYIILKERPQWVITTGAEIGTAAVIAGKILFRKTIFVETASRYRTKTVAARICYPLVDKFYVQQKEALDIYGGKAEYIGGVL
ncbi:MAG: UDP-N-acetylglucosamine transferase subunit ALG14 [Lentisphaeria bacterium]|nr:UDP-N-acetylglucosamine transferase subunit ALG14 [Lentisphaeria bacterium]